MNTLALPGAVLRTPGTIQAFGFALAVEILLLVVVSLIQAHHKQPVPKLPEPVKLTIVSAPELPKQVEQPKPVPHIPKPKPLMQHIVHPRPVPVPPPPKPNPEPTPPKTATPTPFTEPVPAPAPPAPPPTATNNLASLHAEYADHVRAAVQTAVFYPPAAAILHFSGRVRVEFHLRDSIPDNARVLVSSNLGLIDRAALQAVETAQYPAPPEDLRGKDLVYQVWVALTLTH